MSDRDHNGVIKEDPFLKQYQQSDLRIASEFLTTWLPYLSKDLCPHCATILSDRIHSLHPPDLDGAVPIENENENSNNNEDRADTNSLGSWKDEADCTSSSKTPPAPQPSATPLIENSPTTPALSWADMAQEEEEEEEEDELADEEDESAASKRTVSFNTETGELRISKEGGKHPKLPREQREYIRFKNVERNKDFVCLERIKGKIVNVLEGLELHKGVFSAVEQKRIVDYVYQLQEMGSKGELRDRTYTAPQRWMRGKGRVTIQYGCCYNYATDKNGNPPGILRTEIVDPIPSLFKVIIRRLVKWHVLPPSCVPDSCIVNIYNEGDCIPPHIDNHDFIRPFCTVSFLSECKIVFGANLKVVGAGEFDGSFALPLPVGSVLVLNGNAADVAKHCVPSVPTKRISITFRKMDELKRPNGFVPEPDLQEIQPLPYEVEEPRTPKSEHVRKQPVGRWVETKRFVERQSQSDPYYSSWGRRGPRNSGRVRVDFGG